jgi:hypothetical protein
MDPIPDGYMECSGCGGFGWIEEPAYCSCEYQCNHPQSYQVSCRDCVGFGWIEIMEALAG